jgi:acyl-CoA synthetase (AMP-forming)/AMP-acid ligase II
VRGPSVSSGYWGREELTRQTFGGFTADGAGPFLRTGDIGVLRAGELYVSGRIKELIIVHGQKVFPQDIEHELRRQCPGLGAVGAIFTVPSEGKAQEPVVVVHEIGNVSPDRMAPLAREVLHTAVKEFGVAVESVLLVLPGAIPRTSSGKVKRVETRDLYTAGALDPVYQHTT